MKGTLEAVRETAEEEEKHPEAQQKCGSAPLVGRGEFVLQLVVLWWSWNEDGGNVEDDGGSVGMTQLVDHDGGQNHAQNLNHEEEDEV